MTDTAGNPQLKTKSRKLAAVLAILLGPLGAHRFYLGRADGVLYLLLSLIGLFALVWIVGLVEGVRYLAMSEASWVRFLNPHLLDEADRRRARRAKLVRIGIAFALLAALLGWMLVRERQAESAARAFCDSVEVGAPFEAVRERAGSVGHDPLRIIADDRITVGFVGIPPFSRHLCTVHGKDGQVTGAEYFYLD